MITLKIPKYLWPAVIAYNLPMMEDEMSKEKNTKPLTKKITIEYPTSKIIIRPEEEEVIQ